jgi:hypothetical protein
VAAYALVLSEQAAITLAMAARREQRKLTVILDVIKASPFRAGDLKERDTQGRVHEVLIAEEWLVTFWPDHAVHELRVVRLERVED